MEREKFALHGRASFFHCKQNFLEKEETRARAITLRGIFFRDYSVL